MELVSARSARPDQTGLLEDGQVLRDRLPGGADAVPHREPAADLEQGLLVALGQLVEDRASGRIGEGPIDVSHVADYRQVITCLSTSGRAQAGNTVQQKKRVESS